MLWKATLILFLLGVAFAPYLPAMIYHIYSAYNVAAGVVIALFAAGIVFDENFKNAVSVGMRDFLGDKTANVTSETGSSRMGEFSPNLHTSLGSSLTTRVTTSSKKYIQIGRFSNEEFRHWWLYESTKWQSTHRTKGYFKCKSCAARLRIRTIAEWVVVSTTNAEHLCERALLTRVSSTDQVTVVSSTDQMTSERDDERQSASSQHDAEREFGNDYEESVSEQSAVVRSTRCRLDAIFDAILTCLESIQKFVYNMVDVQNA